MLARIRYALSIALYLAAVLVILAVWAAVASAPFNPYLRPPEPELLNAPAPR
jgi:uncharacterized membrane protein